MAKLTLILPLSEEVKEYEEKNEAVCIVWALNILQPAYSNWLHHIHEIVMKGTQETSV